MKIRQSTHKQSDGWPAIFLVTQFGVPESAQGPPHRPPHSHWETHSPNPAQLKLALKFWLKKSGEPEGWPARATKATKSDTSLRNGRQIANCCHGYSDNEGIANGECGNPKPVEWPHNLCSIIHFHFPTVAGILIWPNSNYGTHFSLAALSNLAATVDSQR